MRLYVTGDIHREKERLTDSVYGIAGVLRPGDAVIICGDFQFLFDGEPQEEEEILDELAALPYGIWFCDGNHENFRKLNAYPQERWNGVRIHRIRPNIVHLMRGQVYELCGRTFFVMGGGLVLAGTAWLSDRLHYLAYAAGRDHETGGAGL